MKFIITENKLLSVMTDFVKKNYPDALSPLKTRLKLKGIGNSGWGSSMHDYKYYDTIYYTDNGSIMLVEYDDRDSSEIDKWTVNNRLETMYDFFGEESVEQFFLNVHKIDISQKGNKKYNWVFDSLPSSI